jgi:hypothetical protein
MTIKERTRKIKEVTERKKEGQKEEIKINNERGKLRK